MKRNYGLKALSNKMASANGDHDRLLQKERARMKRQERLGKLKRKTKDCDY